MKINYLTKLSLLISISLVLSYIEILLSIPYPIPGAKIGLTNIITLYSLYKLDLKSAIIIILGRIFLSGFLFGNFASIIYSLAGAFASVLIMFFLIKTDFNILLISIVGAITHNLAQLFVAYLITKTIALFYSYSFLLIFSGIITGLFIGLIVKISLSKLPSF